MRNLTRGAIAAGLLLLAGPVAGQPLLLAASPPAQGYSKSQGVLFGQESIISSAGPLSDAKINSTKFTVFYAIRANWSLYNKTTGASPGTLMMGQDSPHLCETSAGTAPSPCFASDITQGRFAFNGASGIEIDAAFAAYQRPSEWAVTIISGDTATGAYAFYTCAASTSGCEDEAAAGRITSTLLPASVATNFNTVSGLRIGSAWSSANGGTRVEFTDFAIAPGENVACLTTADLITRDGARHSCAGGIHKIPTDILARLWDDAAGKMMDVGAHCQGPFGTATELCLRGGPNEIINNTGTAAWKPFVAAMSPNEKATGTTAPFYAGIYPSAYGPGTGMIPGRPTLRWASDGYNAGAGSGTAFGDINTSGGTVVLHDRLIFAMGFVSAGGNFDHALTCPAALTGGATSWTSSGNLWPGSNVNNYIVCHKDADAQDVKMAASFNESSTAAVDTSTTSVTTAASGVFVFTTVGTGKFSIGDRIIVYNNGAGAQGTYMIGPVTATGLNMVTMTSELLSGAAVTKADWTLKLSGYKDTWTMNGSNPGLNIASTHSVLLNYAQTSAVNAISTNPLIWANPRTVVTAPSVTTSVPTTVVSIWMDDNVSGGSFSNFETGPYNVRYKQARGGTHQFVEVADEYDVPASTTTARSLNIKAHDGTTNQATSTFGVTIALQN